ncbi:MAG: hypothetical protein ACKVX7_13130 [Planctomycetota bacterium]
MNVKKKMRWSGLAVVVLANTSWGQLTVVNQFDTISAVGLGYDHTAGDVWMYPNGGNFLQQYSAAGVLLGTVPRPGESANDADIEFTVGVLTLGSTILPDATLLFINGEDDFADIYAVDKATGAVLATMETDFGVSHVVGGAHHPSRGTIFLLQDNVPAGTVNDNQVAEIDPVTGAVLQTWYTTTSAPTFTIDYADIEVAGNGNLVIVSADESSVGEFTPEGVFVTLRALPAGVSNLSGIGVDEASCQWWVIETNGQVARLGGLSGDPVCSPSTSGEFTRGDANSDGALNIADAVYVLGALFVTGSPALSCADSGDANDDGFFNIADAVFALNWLFVPTSPAPPSPGPTSCGPDPTSDALDCAWFAACP